VKGEGKGRVVYTEGKGLARGKRGGTTAQVNTKTTVSRKVAAQ